MELYLLADPILKEAADLVYISVPEHHLLVVAFDLMWISGFNQHGKMVEDLNFLSQGLRVEDSSEVGEVCEIGVILHHIPPKKLIVAIPLFDSFQHSSAFDFLLDDWLVCIFYFNQNLWFLFHRLIQYNYYIRSRRI